MRQFGLVLAFHLAVAFPYDYQPVQSEPLPVAFDIDVLATVLLLIEVVVAVPYCTVEAPHHPFGSWIVVVGAFAVVELVLGFVAAVELAAVPCLPDSFLVVPYLTVPFHVESFRAVDPFVPFLLVACYPATAFAAAELTVVVWAGSFDVASGFAAAFGFVVGIVAATVVSVALGSVKSS